MKTYIVHYLEYDGWHYDECTRISNKYYNQDNKLIDNKNIYNVEKK